MFRRIKSCRGYCPVVPLPDCPAERRSLCSRGYLRAQHAVRLLDQAFGTSPVPALPYLDRTFPGFSHDIHGAESAADRTYRVVYVKDGVSAG